MDAALVQYLVQGGAVGLAAIAMWVLYKIVTNHMVHMTDAIKELTIVLREVKQIISDKL